MTKRMLIDAAHPEETRVVIVDGTRVEELDFESSNKRQLRGNVYLAKVTRVEPSLQAAFIDYGGNRHGFLAFSEIHPDYYQIPYEDKLALQQQEEEDLSKDSDEDDVEEDEHLDPDEDDASDENDAEVASEQVKVASRRRKQIRRRRYKIQEVIKRGQILLVQAVKEERGNKGAAMTTYLSLAGRYCVLMPNTPRGGGISRKISNGTDRKRLKSVMDDLSVPHGMGVIVRTAGAKRTKAEIKRDYDYLSRLWDDIRETTLKSVAPALIHEEGNLVKRSIRDLYNKEIGEVLVQGEEAYKTAKSFIKMLMPSHAKFVKRYDEVIPLFLRYDVERQIENSLDATVQLKSGGYLVIHPTEALVSVDVNSGKSTKERNVERTALKTNLEAAEELARQMRLRDLAGLIVVDFIDMDENKNNRAVERKMKEVLSRDRARIQTSRISQFGLMEISRQRRRRSLLEGSTAVCKHCDGVGRKRTVESAALAAIRAVEEFAIRGKAKKIRLKCPPDVALYLLNEKRDLLTKVDENADVFTVVEHDDDLIRPAFTIEVAEKRSDGRKDPLVDIEKEIQEEAKQAEKDRQNANSKGRSKSDDEDESDEEAEAHEAEAQDEEENNKPRRRRGRRGGRNRKRRSSSDTESKSDDSKSDSSDESDAKSEDTQKDAEDASDKPKPRRRRRRKAKSGSDSQTSDSESKSDTSPDSKDADDNDETPVKRRSSSRRKAPSRSSKDAESGSKAEKTDSKPETSDTTASKDSVSDDDTSSRRRKAPSRKSSSEKSDTVSKSDEEAKPKRRRKAPATKKAEASADAEEAKAEAKPTRRRKAPAKAKAAETSAADASDDAPKPKRRRKAPSKSSETSDAEAEASKPKPTRRRAAPKKAAETAQADDAAEDAPKPKRKRAPRKKAEPAKTETPQAAEPEADAPKPKRRRKAPARKSSEAKAEPSKAEPKPEKASDKPAAAEDAETEGRRRKAPPRRKRGLIDRLMGKE